MADTKPQLLHLVFGGELADLDGAVFRDPAALDIVGIFPNYAAAERAWRAKAQSTVDNASMRYVIVHLHRFLDPMVTGTSGGTLVAGKAPGAGGTAA